ncbi:MAG: ABC transporter ATP-binding protein [Nitrospiraceae bacterium]
MEYARASRPGIRMDWVLWSYLSTLARIASWKAALALALMVCLSLTEGVGIVMLVPLLHLVGLDVQQGALGGIAEFLSSMFTAVNLQPTLVSVLGVYILITSLYGLLARWQATVNLAVQHGCVASLRQRLYRAISRTTWLFFSRSRSSDFTHALTAEVERVGAATYHLLHVMACTIVALVYLVIAAKLSPVMTGLVVACGGGLLLWMKGRTRSAHAAGEGVSQAMASLFAAVTEHLGGMKTAKSYGAEDRHAEVFSTLTERVRHMYLRIVRNQADVKYWFDLGSVLVLSLFVYVSFEVLALSTAEVLVLLFLFVRLMPRFSGILEGVQSFAATVPAFASVGEMQARCEAAAEPRAQRTEPIELLEAIHLDRVSFKYHERPIIRELELTIQAGGTTAIIGPSGAGKSTVADLVMGLILPDEGQVLIDGIALDPERMRAWRAQIGYVAQETFLFHDTVRANLLWARPEAVDEEVTQAVRAAAAEEFISKLPMGLDTVVGDRGVQLSGGERQRLALARALLRQPALLILDEATSALDSENERRIQQAIEELHGATTILVISHRLSAIRRADVIYVLEEGELVESGSRETLLAREEGRFQAFCGAQGQG